MANRLLSFVDFQEREVGISVIDRTEVNQRHCSYAKLDQHKNIGHQNHIMESSLDCPSADAAYSIAGRLTFAQLLLVTTYTFLRSCLLFRIGDDRQIRDIL